MADETVAAAWWQGLAGRLGKLPEADADARRAALERQNMLTKPPGALGRLEELAIWLAGWQGQAMPKLDRVQAVVFAGNHGVTAQGVSPYPPSVTAQMTANFEAGGAAICQLCEAYGAELSVVALELDRPTGDIAVEPAMSERDCMMAMAEGGKAVATDADLILLGEMGIGNTTVAAALTCALLGGAPADWVGPGTGHDEAGIARKVAAVAQAMDTHKAHIDHPLEALRRLGGRELAAIAGAIIEARHQRIPVLLDGYVCGAAALVVEHAQTGALDHCVMSHLSSEPGHRRMLDAIDRPALLDLGMRLGEGTGAAMALGVLRGALATHNGMATFAEAGVDDRD